METRYYRDHVRSLRRVVSTSSSRWLSSSACGILTEEGVLLARAEAGEVRIATDVDDADVILTASSLGAPVQGE
jgi:hypothetical protein